MARKKKEEIKGEGTGVEETKGTVGGESAEAGELAGSAEAKVVEPVELLPAPKPEIMAGLVSMVKASEERFKADGDKYERAIFPFAKVETHTSFPNVRSDMMEVADLKASIMERGLQNPLLVWEYLLDAPVIHPELGEIDKRYFLIAGFRRMAALQMIRQENPSEFAQLPVSIFKGTYEEALIENLVENIQRTDPTALDIGTQLMRVEAMGRTQSEIAQMIGKSRPWVNFALKLAKGEGIIESLQNAVRERKVNFWTALTFSMRDKDVQRKFCRVIYDAYKEGKSAEELTKIVKDLEKKASTRRKMRGIAEVKEQLQNYLDQDMSTLDTMQISHLYGFMKGLFWALNYEIPLDKIDPDEWMPPEFRGSKGEEKKPAKEEESE